MHFENRANLIGLGQFFSPLFYTNIMITSTCDGSVYLHVRPTRPDFHFCISIGHCAAVDRHLFTRLAIAPRGDEPQRGADALHSFCFFIGFGLGQVVFGPLSDRVGRKGPLVAGLCVYVIASIACARSSTMSQLVLWRFVQAVGGSVIPPVVQAMVLDLYDRDQSARILSLNMLVTASAPIIAPLIGGQVLLWSDWRGIFWVLVAFGLISLMAALSLSETLAKSRRNEAHPIAMMLGYVTLVRNPRYIGYVTCSTLYFCCLFAFIAAAASVVKNALYIIVRFVCGALVTAGPDVIRRSGP